MPDSSAEDGLRYSLDILCADRSDPDGTAFVRQSILVAERALREQRYRSELAKASFPRNRGGLLRARAYASAILGYPLDVEGVRQASHDYEEYCKWYGPSDWDSQAQAYYLAAVRLALIAGDPERAAALLKIRRSFNWHAEEFAIMNTPWASISEDTRPALLAAFDDYFDRIRNPELRPDVFMELDILRIELAAIRDKYLISHDRQIDWKRVIDAIAA